MLEVRPPGLLSARLGNGDRHHVPGLSEQYPGARRGSPTGRRDLEWRGHPPTPAPRRWPEFLLARLIGAFRAPGLAGYEWPRRGAYPSRIAVIKTVSKFMTNEPP
jgi:hypothetical protein